MTTPGTGAGRTAWDDAVLAAALLALDPTGVGGVLVRAPAGPVRDAWLALVRSLLPDHLPIRRLPLHATTDRIVGGLDLAATLATGRRVIDKGVLACADGGCVLLPMAERWPVDAVMHVASALDTGRVLVERDGLQARMPARFAVIAFDEGLEDDERPALALSDRLAFHLDLRDCRLADTVVTVIDAQRLAVARTCDAKPAIDSEIVKALCAAALVLGIRSLRAPLMAVTVARRHARLQRRSVVTEEDAAIAARLVLAPRATAAPSQSQSHESDAEQDQPEDAARTSEPANADASTTGESVSQLDDRIVAAALAALPKHVLEGLAGRSGGAQPKSEGKAGVPQRSSRRGRSTGVRPASRDEAARLNVLATLRAAAPWQRIRRAEMGAAGRGRSGVCIRRSDFRVNTYKHPSGSTIIFAVDASGSSALHRLAEAKGAVELLLADCYARRDSVALVSFRGSRAELLLAPSRSLARAKRSLAGLPGGGGTPLASGIETAKSIADVARRKGDVPLIVVMTDGRANVTRAGTGGRAEAEAHAIAAAREVRAAGIAALLIDTSPRPHPFAAVVATELGSRYVVLPQADAGSISRVIEIERASSAEV